MNNLLKTILDIYPFYQIDTLFDKKDCKVFRVWIKILNNFTSENSIIKKDNINRKNFYDSDYLDYYVVYKNDEPWIIYNISIGYFVTYTIYQIQYLTSKVNVYKSYLTFDYEYSTNEILDLFSKEQFEVNISYENEYEIYKIKNNTWYYTNNKTIIDKQLNNYHPNDIYHPPLNNLDKFILINEDDNACCTLKLNTYDYKTLEINKLDTSLFIDDFVYDKENTDLKPNKMFKFKYNIDKTINTIIAECMNIYFEYNDDYCINIDYKYKYDEDCNIFINYNGKLCLK